MIRAASSSLRAQRSNPSNRETSKHGLLRFARNDGAGVPDSIFKQQTRLRDPAARSARTLLETSRPKEIRGRRECRMRAAPEVSCAPCTKAMHTSIQVKRRHPTFPAQWLYGLLRALPGEPCTFATAGANFGAPGPHDLAVHISAVRYRHLRVHRDPSHVRGDHETPL